VLLLEVATGLKPAEVVVQQQGAGGLLSNTLISAVQESYAKGELLQMADERLNGDFDERQMERVLLVGLLCVQQHRRDRPEIRTAVNLLSDLNYPVPQFRSP
jgi:interleukin-1 receptor-associated kinase 1